MNPIPLNIAVEDELSELVALRLIDQTNGRYTTGNVFRRGGYGYLKRTIRGWNRAAKGQPFLVLTDLDNERCATILQQKWLQRDKLEPNLIFRIAVREVEAWLLADWESLLDFLRVPAKRAGHLPPPASTESLPDPKAQLIELASQSMSREIRSQIVPRVGGTAKQGPEYNQCLAPFVESQWNVRRATVRNRSLEKAVDRLSAFLPQFR